MPNVTNWFRENASARFAVRSLVAAVISYLVMVWGSGQEAFELSSFMWGLAGAVIYAVQGLLLPTEPLVGVKTKVEIESPPQVVDVDDDTDEP